MLGALEAVRGGLVYGNCPCTGGRIRFLPRVHLQGLEMFFLHFFNIKICFH